jgi:tetratricopeptide (TPR) repeat protein
MNAFLKNGLIFFSTASGMLACNGTGSGPSKESVAMLNLKSGPLISCGPPDKEFGVVDFEMTCDKNQSANFNIAVELLHSFEYDESEKAFAKIIDESPECAMAYWGVAMCNFHPLWEAPTEANLIKGSRAIEIARSISGKSEKETGYINATAAYYNNWNKTDPHTRSIRFEKTMEQLHNTYPDDKEMAVFYALALDAAADPADKSYTNQKKAGEILNALYNTYANHPGIIHYIIHTYDYPGIANLGLPAARRYAAVAPSSAHALHMPSHIFTRLGLWDDCIKSNLASVEAARCYAESAGIRGHWDEELHGLDYLLYAFLQKGDNKKAGELLNYIESIDTVYPVNFKGAYTFAAAPSRMALENKNWQEAAALPLHPADFPWATFPWQEAIIHFTRLLGAAHAGNLTVAQSELAKLNSLKDTLKKQKDLYKSNQVAIQIKTGEAWISWMKKNNREALNLMKTASDMEDSTSKHPVTPGEVLPARELYADMLLHLQQNELALQTYESVLKKSPDRFNSLYGAGLSAERSGKMEKAVYYYRQLSEIAAPDSNRPELQAANAYLKRHA